jgi:hypothetical protein
MTIYQSVVWSDNDTIDNFKIQKLIDNQLALKEMADRVPLGALNNNYSYVANGVNTTFVTIFSKTITIPFANRMIMWEMTWGNYDYLNSTINYTIYQYYIDGVLVATRTTDYSDKAATSGSVTIRPHKLFFHDLTKGDHLFEIKARVVNAEFSAGGTAQAYMFLHDLGKSVNPS